MVDILFGLDIGTTKVCALVGEVRDGQLRIIGVGLESSQGMRKGMVTDVTQATEAIARAVEEAERTSGYDLSRALVSMAGEHISSTNNHGVVAIGRNSGGIAPEDIERALDATQAISIPHNRQIVHLLPRRFTVDMQEGVRNPVGMHGYRLEVEAHIVTAATPSLMNLRQCADQVGLTVEEFVLNVLASGEAVLEPTEREMGVMVADIGGGTSDVALYVDGMVWHTNVIPVGGNHITNDIAILMRVPFEVAEKVKLQHGDCRPDQIDPESVFTLEPFGGERIRVGRQELAQVIEARVDEIFHLILDDIRRSGYERLLPAGIVLTGGASQMRGIANIASRVMGVQARVAMPHGLVGLVERLQSPAYATSVGLLQWAISGHNAYRPQPRQPDWGRRIKSIFGALLPDREVR
jgi:cell division protein FtsA